VVTSAAQTLALPIQSTTVVLINIVNGTPSIVATVAPSILFSAVYGFSDARALRGTESYQCPEPRLSTYKGISP
jgi:hypothetical protein